MEELQLDGPARIGPQMLTSGSRVLGSALILIIVVAGSSCGGSRSDTGFSQSFLEEQEERTATLSVDPCEVLDRNDIGRILGGPGRRRAHQTLLWKTCTWQRDGVVLDVLVSPEGEVIEPSLRRGAEVDLGGVAGRAVYERRAPLDREGRGISVVVAVNGSFGMVGLSGPHADGSARLELETVARKLAAELAS
jgi:hypothetical protein